MPDPEPGAVAFALPDQRRLGVLLGGDPDGFGLAYHPGQVVTLPRPVCFPRTDGLGRPTTSTGWTDPS